MNPTRRGFLGLVAALAAAPAAAWRAVTSGRRSVVEGGRVFTTGVMEAPGPIVTSGLVAHTFGQEDVVTQKTYVNGDGSITRVTSDSFGNVWTDVFNRGADGRA